jgi:hypothetical protein
MASFKPPQISVPQTKSVYQLFRNLIVESRTLEEFKNEKK